MAKKQKSAFSKFYKAYVLILVILLVAVAANVFVTMKSYEAAVPENFVEDLILKSGNKDKGLGQFLKENIFSEGAVQSDYCMPEELSKKYYNTVASAELTIKRDLLNTKGNILVFSVYADEKPFMSIAIEKVSAERRLGFLEIADYEFKYAFLRSENSELSGLSYSEDGTIDFTISFPEGFAVYTGEKEIVFSVEEQKSAISDLEAAGISDLKGVPSLRTYTVSLNYEPEFTVKNNLGEEVALKAGSGRSYYAENKFACSEEDEKSLVSDYGNIIETYKTWAKFMTDDIGGVQHGFEKVCTTCKILPDSKLEELARKWSKGVDITFVSNHSSLKWGEENVSNFQKYSDNLISCDVYLEEQILVNGTGWVIQTYNNRLYFMYEDGAAVKTPGWYWVGQLDLTGRE